MTTKKRRVQSSRRLDHDDLIAALKSYRKMAKIVPTSKIRAWPTVQTGRMSTHMQVPTDCETEND